MWLNQDEPQFKYVSETFVSGCIIVDTWHLNSNLLHKLLYVIFVLHILFSAVDRSGLCWLLSFSKFVKWDFVWRLVYSSFHEYVCAPICWWRDQFDNWRLISMTACTRVSSQHAFENPVTPQLWFICLKFPFLLPEKKKNKKSFSRVFLKGVQGKHSSLLVC